MNGLEVEEEGNGIGKENNVAICCVWTSFRILFKQGMLYFSYPRISDTEFRVTDLKTRISNVGLRISNLGSLISNLESVRCHVRSVIHPCTYGHTLLAYVPYDPRLCMISGRFGNSKKNIFLIFLGPHAVLVQGCCPFTSELMTTRPTVELLVGNGTVQFKPTECGR